MITLCLATMLLGCSPTGRQQAGFDTTYRWFLLNTYLQRPAEVEKAIKAIDDAGAAGYNGVVYQDTSTQSLEKFSPAYLAALQKVMAEAKKMNLEFIPSVGAVGGSPLLGRDNSVVESMPCRNVRFIVTGGVLKPADPPIPIVNGGLDAFTGELPTGFKGTHQDDVALFPDTAVHHGGTASLRVEGKSQKDGGGIWFQQPLIVRPWHQYRVSFWTKSDGPAGSNAYLNVLSSTSAQIGSPAQWHASPDWVQTFIIFNSQDDNQVTLSVGVRPSVGGKVWVDDIAMEDVGLLNVTRRANTPVLIKGDDGVIYNEGADIAPVAETFRVPGFGPGHFDNAHTPPAATILPNSRLHEGQIVSLDYYAAVLVYGEPTICINEPKAKKMFKEEMQRTFDTMHPHFVFLNIDEIRALGWDPACEATGQTAGEMLAKFCRDESQLAKSIDPTVQIVTYNDMFDPYHNSNDQYYFAKGGTSGSINGVPKDTIIVNWNHTKTVQSLNYFSNLGYKQIIWGYYDNTDHPIPIKEYEKMCSGIPGIKGFGYVTWIEDYSQLGSFYQQAMSTGH